MSEDALALRNRVNDPGRDGRIDDRDAADSVDGRSRMSAILDLQWLVTDECSIAESASEVDRWLETQRAEAHSRDRVNGHDGQDGTVVPRTKGQKASAGRAGRAGRAGNLAH